jgi:hypothetical protein
MVSERGRSQQADQRAKTRELKFPHGAHPRMR